MESESERLCFRGGSSYISDNMFYKYEWQGWALNNNNDFAGVTLAYEDCQQGEAHKVILAGQVLFH